MYKDLPLLGSGYSYDVYDKGDRVLRVPKENVSRHPYERTIHNYLNDSGVQVPHIYTVHGEGGKNGVEYDKVVGKQLTRSDIYVFDDTQKKKLIKTIVDILVLMKDFGEKEGIKKRLIDEGMDIYDKQELFAMRLGEWFEKMPEYIKPYVQDMHDLINKYKGLRSETPIQSTLLHNDIYPDNIMYDKQAGRFTLIDFSDLTYADIHTEFTRLRDPEEVIIHEVLKSYTDRTGISLSYELIRINAIVFCMREACKNGIGWQYERIKKIYGKK